VGAGSLALGADGALDGTFMVTLSANGGRTITRLQLQSSAPGSWDTDGTTSAWVLGVALALDGALLNDPATMAVSFPVADGGSFRLFAADWADIEFLPGTTLTVTAVFSDGTSASAATVAMATPSAPSLALIYNAKLRDRVGRAVSDSAPMACSNGTLAVTSSAASGRTITPLQRRSSAPAPDDGATFEVCAADFGGIEFIPGATLALTATGRARQES
jgi:hypothetical protein